jgi:radical SAM protein with 4Fe4S-binding SPASM domain
MLARSRRSLPPSRDIPFGTIGTPELQTRPRDPELPICGIGTYMMCLGANGDFYPCPGFALSLGNVSRQALREVWDNSPQIRELRAIRSDSNPSCLACESWDFCPSCMSRHYSETGSLVTLSEHVCAVTHLNRRMAVKWRAEHVPTSLD